MKRKLTVILALPLGVACSSSTSPTSRSNVLRAAYVDSVMQANCVGGGNAACDLTQDVLRAMSDGAVPSRIPVVTPQGTVRWWAIVVTSYQRVGQAPRVDTTEDIILYPDSTFTSGMDIHVYFNVSGYDNGVALGGGSTYVGNTEIGGADVAGSTAIVSTTTPCTTVSGMAPNFPLSICRFATYRVSASAQLGAFPAFTIVQQDINGVIAGPL